MMDDVELWVYFNGPYVYSVFPSFASVIDFGRSSGSFLMTVTFRRGSVTFTVRPAYSALRLFRCHARVEPDVLSVAEIEAETIR
jgi:hypothetical protein